MGKVVLTHTMRTRIFSCERKAFLAGLCGLRKKETKAALRIGTNFDRLAGRTVMPREILGEYERLEAEALTIEEADNLAVECRMVLTMARLYDEKFPEGEEEESNIRFRHPIYSPGGRAHPRVDAGGELDGLDGTRLIERKTTGLTVEQRTRFLGTDNQITAYVYGAVHGLKREVESVSYRVARKSRLRQKKGESHGEFSDRVVNDLEERKDDYLGETLFLGPTFRSSPGDQERWQWDLVRIFDHSKFARHLWQAARRFNDMLMRGAAFSAPRSKSGTDLLESYRELGSNALDAASEPDPAFSRAISKRFLLAAELYPGNSSACGDFGGCEFFAFCSLGKCGDLSDFAQSSHLNPELANAQ